MELFYGTNNIEINKAMKKYIDKKDTKYINLDSKIGLTLDILNKYKCVVLDNCESMGI